LTAEGHICVNLSTYAEKTFPLSPEEDSEFLRCPSLSDWIDSLKNSDMVGTAKDYKPLILNGNNLYLYRYWIYEQQFSTAIQNRLKNQRTDINREILAQGLSRLFPDNQADNQEIDEQKLAAEKAVLNNFSIISGGPGTGKTSTIIKILALLLEQDKNLHIALTAPTGKATARLQESITTAKQNLNCAPDIKSLIPQETHTLHRLLGTVSNSPYFRKNADNPLSYDVIIVDEASMVDLPLMAKLAQAIPQHARWILVGDKSQLASVEAGTVFGDICETDTEKSYITVFKRNYRFDKNSGIGELAKAINTANSDKALNLLKSYTYADIRWHTVKSYGYFLNDLKNKIIHGFNDYLNAIKYSHTEPENVLQSFDKFRVLCALRQGLYGVERVNRAIESALIKEGFLKAGYRWYHGQPIMITRNDYTLKLFNGDVGIVLRNPEKYSELLVFFRAADGNIREFLPSRLPQHETVFAMTVHKSQGSEFDKVLIVLPTQFSAVLSRELLYTGITRAKKRLDIWGDESVFKQAIQQKIQRTSGLQNIST